MDNETKETRIIPVCILDIAFSVTGNVLLSLLFPRLLGLPIYLDSVFTVAVTLFAGLLPGLATAFFYSLVSGLLLQYDGFQVLFSLCGMATALLTWLIAGRGKKEPSVFDLSILALLATVANSVIGGIISIALHGGRGQAPGDPLVAGMIMQGIPAQFAAILTRIPLNLIDLTIAAFVGYGLYRIAKWGDSLG